MKRKLVLDRAYEMNRDLGLNDHEFCVVLDTMQAASDEMKETCALSLQPIIDDCKKTT